jgi:hypothetical protein
MSDSSHGAGGIGVGGDVFLYPAGDVTGLDAAALCGWIVRAVTFRALVGQKVVARAA